MAANPAPVPSGGKPQQPLPTPIGEVQILVYAWDRGKTEVRVKFPKEAVSGNPGAAAKQASFRSLVMAELDDSFKLLIS